MEVVVFKLDAQRFGLLVAEVQEVVRAVALAPLPKAPLIVEGVINARGRLVPVLDVRARFRLPPRSPSPSDFLVLARAGERLVALRVDAGVHLVQLAVGDVESLEQVVSGAGYVSGVGKLPDGLVLIHDLRTFLASAEAAQLDEALHAGDASSGERTR
ncbi:MAG TPA: chemotaxis protein CheW [bacterium]|jgi:purine-binding chemotaxis protein CheW